MASPYFFHDNPLSGVVPVVAEYINIPDANKIGAKVVGTKRGGFYYTNNGSVNIILGIGYLPTDTKGIVIPPGASYPFEISSDVLIGHKAVSSTSLYTYQEFK